MPREIDLASDVINATIQTQEINPNAGFLFNNSRSNNMADWHRLLPYSDCIPTLFTIR